MNYYSNPKCTINKYSMCSKYEGKSYVIFCKTINYE